MGAEQPQSHNSSSPHSVLGWGTFPRLPPQFNKRQASRTYPRSPAYELLSFHFLRRTKLSGSLFSSLRCFPLFTISQPDPRTKMSERSPSQEAVSAGSSSKRKRRVYQACEPCRIRKAKCDRGSDGLFFLSIKFLKGAYRKQDDPRPPPCARCKRESIQSQCVLASKRNKRDIGLADKFQSRETTQYSSETNARQPGLRSGEEVSRGISAGPAASDSGDFVESPFANAASPGSGHVLQANSPYSHRSHRSMRSTEDLDSGRYTSGSRRNLTDNVIHTLVSKPNDALALLFEAAERSDPSAINSRRQSLEPLRILRRNADNSLADNEAGRNPTGHPSGIPTPRSTVTSPAQAVPDPSGKMIELWKTYRFVREGWLTAREAVLYVDLYVPLQ